MEKPWMSQWPQDVPQSLQYPTIHLGEVLRKSAKEAPNITALVYFGTRLAYRNLDDLVDTFGFELQARGIKKGDRVAVYMPNIPQFVVSYYAILRIGGVAVAISPLFKERELSHILVDSGASAIVAWDKLYSYVEKVRNKTSLAHMITTSVRDYLPPVLRLLSPLKGVKSYRCPGAEDMKALLGSENRQSRPVEIDPEKDLALLQYTGGTTGTPKAALLTHFNLVANSVQVSEWCKLRPGEETHLSALPFFHIYGMTVAMNAPIYTRSSMILIPDPRDIRTVLKAIDKYRPTIFCGVPTMYVALINQPDIGKHNLQSIRTCVSGAAALPVEVQRRFEELTGGRLVEGYGLTETSPVTHVNPLDDRSKNRPGSIGIPISDTEGRIVDLETGTRDLPPGETGELTVRGPQVMMGYWNKPDENKMALRDGWFYTGDIAVMDPDGYFRIVDRKKDMINVSGLKVWPREVEEVLYEHPAVKEAAVIGLPDARTGETVKAFVVPKADYASSITADEITDFCKQKIAAYKAPKIVEFRPELPKTQVGKILRRELRTTQAA